MTGNFTIQWEDDEKELFFIHDETSLFEAIDFYHSGDEGSVASSGSIFSSRSSRHPKITMDVAICIDYDGPSLSETSSVASREEDPLEGSESSFLPGELSGSPLDDDAVTISSKDTRGKGRDASLLKKLWNGTSRSAGSSSSCKPSLKPSRSRIFNIGSRASSTEEDTSGGSVRVRLDGRSSGSVMDTERPYPGDPSAVLERLRLEEHRDPPVLETDRGKAWLQNQNTLQRALLGVLPSMNDDSSSLNTDSPLSDGISLQRDKRGKLYYNLTSVGTSEPADDLEYDIVNGIQPSESQVLGIVPSLNFVLYRQRHTPFSRSSGTRGGHRLLRMWEYPRPDQVHLHDLRREDAHVTDCARGSHSGCGKRQESRLSRPSSWE